MGSSPFARHYSGNRGFFPFLWVLRCFSSPACHYPAYVFSWKHARITTRRFPHSEIPGSAIGQHLPRAYRSRPRPSSALGAKASTVCSYSLDQKEHVVLSLWSFQGARRAALKTHSVRPASRTARRRRKPTELGLSKLNSVRPTNVEVDVHSRRTVSSDEQAHRRPRIRRASACPRAQRLPE